jgi:hypothetical protein
VRKRKEKADGEKVMKNIYIYIYIYYRSGDSVVNIVTTLRAELTGVRFPVGAIGFVFYETSLRPTQPSVEWVLGRESNDLLP